MSGSGPWLLELHGVGFAVRVVKADAPAKRPATDAEGAAQALASALAGPRPPDMAVCAEIFRALWGDASANPDTIAWTLVDAVRSGTLSLLPEPRPTSHFTGGESPVDLSDLAEPPPANEATTWLEIKVVDEIGEPVDGLDLTVFSDGKHLEKTTNGSGIVRLDDVANNFGSASIADFDQLRAILEPRWESAREGTPPQDALQTVQVLRDDIAAIKLESETPHTLVITPRPGKLFVELHDKSGRVRHAGRPYTISGAASFQGTTDDDGRLLHEGVPTGDYELTLTLAGEDFSDDYTASLVVLDADDTRPQVRMLGVLPNRVMVRVRGMVFETNKNFLVPLALPALQRIRDIYEDNDPGELLVVGHTDTSGEPSVNDPLSIERAESVAAFLADDVQPWLDMYDNGSSAKRWGANEDLMMIGAVTVLANKPPEQNPVQFFQEQHNERVEIEQSGRPILGTDGVAGPKTRRELIMRYMLLDGASLAEDDDNAETFDIHRTVHGCGENFPLDATGEALDQAALDGQDDVADRRVELFFFDRDFGIQPPPPGKNSGKGSTAYPKWRTQADRNDDLFVGPHLLEGSIVYADGTPAAHVAFVVRAGDKAIDGGFTDDDGHYRLTVFSADAEVALVDKLAVGKTVDDPGDERVAVNAVPSPGGVAVA